MYWLLSLYFVLHVPFDGIIIISLSLHIRSSGHIEHFVATCLGNWSKNPPPSYSILMCISNIWNSLFLSPKCVVFIAESAPRTWKRPGSVETVKHFFSQKFGDFLWWMNAKLSYLVNFKRRSAEAKFPFLIPKYLRRYYVHGIQSIKIIKILTNITNRVDSYSVIAVLMIIYIAYNTTAVVPGN